MTVARCLRRALRHPQSNSFASPQRRQAERDAESAPPSSRGAALLKARGPGAGDRSLREGGGVVRNWGPGRVLAWALCDPDQALGVALVPRSAWPSLVVADAARPPAGLVVQRARVSISGRPAQPGSTSLLKFFPDLAPGGPNGSAGGRHLK